VSAVLVQPLASLTDLALGLVSLALAPRVPRAVPGGRYWRAAFAWTAAVALIGAVYHGYLTGGPSGEVTWAVMSVMVVVVMSYLLAATVIAVLGPTRAIVFWPLRLIGFLAYAVIAALGHPSIEAIMYCESLTMACVVGLWVWAAWRRHPAGRAVLLAVGVSIVGALFRLVPGASDLLHIDQDSAYHIGQVVGMVLLYRAVRRSGEGHDDEASRNPVSAPSTASGASSAGK
jgi:hypothetical protein